LAIQASHVNWNQVAYSHWWVSHPHGVAAPGVLFSSH
jgi:hypothetical protein